MNVTINRPVNYEVKTIEVKVFIRNTELYSKLQCMNPYEGYWCPIIDVDEGIITNWDINESVYVFLKVCDEFECTVKDASDAIVASYNGYVLNFMAITDEGYGDYIYLDVNEDGYIENWSFDEYDFKKLDEYYED
jgi:hypothetical protein